jgi:hypothetical protein
LTVTEPDIMAKAAKSKLPRWLAAAAMLVMTGLVADVALTGPALAQFDGSRSDVRPRFQRPSNFFERLFGGGGRTSGPYEMPQQPQQPKQAESSRPPPPKKSDTTPTLSIMVMGDSMADWLAYGLEEAFADSPEIAILRRGKSNSGLLRYDPRSDLDWWHVARDNLAKDKTDFVVMILGVNDRQPFRESQTDKKDKDSKDSKDSGKKPEPDKAANSDSNTEPGKDVAADQKTDDDEPSILAPAPRSAGGAKGVIDFRTERWEEAYTKRIDETIAALKSKGVPVIWVGLPALRGPRSTADAVYLNDLYRRRAEKAGIVYVDVWDGFVDEAGKFTTRGPDFEGQMRNLRSWDGVNFTKYGARKLALYVDRELHRFIANRAMPMALPSDAPAGPMTPDGRPGSTVRPMAGPVVSLTVTPGGENDELLGGNASRPTHTDPVATRVLVKGEPVAPPPGRADDFTWPRPGDANAAIEPLSPTAAAARAEPDSVKNAKAAKAAKAAKNAAKDAKEGKTGAKADTKADKKPKADQKPTRPAGPPRPPQQVEQRPRSNGPFGWLR